MPHLLHFTEIDTLPYQPEEVTILKRSDSQAKFVEKGQMQV